MTENPIISAAVPVEIKLELDEIARHQKITRSATIAMLLRFALEQYHEERKSRFRPVGI